MRVGDNYSLKSARLTEKGKNFLLERIYLEDQYPNSKEALKEWVQVEKYKYSNGAEG